MASNGTFGIIRATGHVGGQISRQESQNLCPLETRLLTQHPELESNQNVMIFEAQLDDTDQLAKFLSGCDSVFLTAAAIDNMPGCSIAQDQAKSVVSALELIRKEDPVAKLPQIIVLSSAALERHFMRDIPEWFNAFLSKGASNIYADL